MRPGVWCSVWSERKRGAKKRLAPALAEREPLVDWCRSESPEDWPLELSDRRNQLPVGRRISRITGC